MFTSDINEGSPEYFLDRTNNAYGFAFYAPTTPVSITVTDEEIIETVVYDGTGTEGHLVGSIGYYIDVRNFGDNPDLKVTGVTNDLGQVDLSRLIDPLHYHQLILNLLLPPDLRLLI